jgi:CheY-like chemotaxis protein
MHPAADLVQVWAPGQRRADSLDQAPAADADVWMPDDLWIGRGRPRRSPVAFASSIHPGGSKDVHALIIEDHPLIASLVASELRELGFASVAIVERQDEAVATARDRCPDLIVADNRLEQGTGLAAIAAICSDRTIPVLFTVGAPLEFRHVVPHAVVIEKPFGVRELREGIGLAITAAHEYGRGERRDP